MSAPSTSLLRVDEARLDNGLRVVGEHNPAAASVAVGVVVETGARDERLQEHGVSHFLEHLCFKGDETRGPADLSRAFDALGARYNASTSEERTVYYGAVLPESGLDLLELLSSLLRPALRADDLEVERKVVLEEIAMYADRPDALVFERGARAYFGDHAYGRGVLGTAESIGSMGRELVHDYWRRRYAPDNLLVVLTGQYDWDTVLRSLERATREWNGSAPPRDASAPACQKGGGNSRKAGLTRAHVAFFAPGVARAHPRRHAAALLAHALGDEDNGTLFWSLVEPGLADSAGLWHDPAAGFGSFQGYVGCSPADLERVLGLLSMELERVQSEGVSEAAWQQAQRSLATGVTLRGETPMGRLVSVASSYLDVGRVRSVPETVEEILGTTLSEGEALLGSKPFDERFVFVLEPAGGGAAG